MSRGRKRERLKARDALDLVPDGIGDGAQMMMAAEFAGMDYDELCMELAADDAGFCECDAAPDDEEIGSGTCKSCGKAVIA